MYLVETLWMPQVKCPLVKAWVSARKNAGLKGQQLIAGFVMAFLDDFFPFLCGSESDIQLGHSIIMDGLAKLGFRLSEPKLLVEGTPDHEGVILGHGVDVVHNGGIRFITPHKKMKIAALFGNFASSPLRLRKTLERERGIRLLQSVRRDVTMRWQL